MIDNILHLFKERYYNLPQPVMRMVGRIYAAAPLGLRFGPAYREHRQALDTFESWDDQQRLDFMFEKTRDVITHASEHVPYYRRLFQEHGFSVDQFRSLEDMSRIPMLTKASVRQHFTDLRAEGAEASIEVFTGGSTSEPMKYLQPLKTSRSKEKAFINHIFEKTGYRYRDRTVLIKGRAVSNENASRYWQYEPIDNYLSLSANHLDVRYMRLMLAEIEKFRPKFFFGFPSAILDFIRACDQLGIDSIPDIQAVFLASENVFAEQTDTIREFFRCDVLTEFGHGERAAIAYRINHEPYDFVSAYGLMRVVDREIVATTFDNAVMPLINYKLADFVSQDYCCYPGTDILKTAGDIEGRLQEFLVTNDGRLISICTMGAGHFSSLRGIDSIQYQQSEPGVATLVVSSSERAGVDSEKIRRQLVKQAENAIEFSVEVVSEIPKSARGKRVMCVQGIDLDDIRSRVGSL
jgi:phenylacetate-CoA ligase